MENVLVIQVAFVAGKPLLWYENSLLIPTSLTYDHLIKMKQLVTGVTAFGAVRAESGSFWVIFGIF